jgi:uncharacterized protein YjbI with pentapeptide repeats
MKNDAQPGTAEAARGQEETRDLHKLFEHHKQLVELEFLERDRRLPQVFISCIRNWNRGDDYRSASLIGLIWSLVGRASATAIVSGVGLIGALGLLLAWQANALLHSQNERLDVQTHLAEAQRRAGLIFELTSILDQVHIERDASRSNAGSMFSPSPELGARIVGLSRSLRPYYFVSYSPIQRNGTSSEVKDAASIWTLLTPFSQLMGPNSPVLGPRPVSPERAQLLLTVAASHIDLFAPSLRGATFAYADLSGNLIDNVSLTAVDLQGASFRNSKLKDVRFDKRQGVHLPARLDNADFTCASFANVFMYWAILDGAKFAHVEMRSFNLTGRKSKGHYTRFPSIDPIALSKADLTDANFDGVELESDLLWFAPGYEPAPKGFERERWVVKEKSSRRWKIESREGSETNKLRGSACANEHELAGIRFASANLKGANLRKAMLPWADLRQTNLEYADLQDAILKGADLSGANLSTANLEGATLVGAQLEGALIANANLRQTNLAYADLQNAILKGANLSGVNLSTANLEGAMLKGAQLKGAWIAGANLKSTDIQQDQLDGTCGVPSAIPKGLRPPEPCN